MPHVAADAFAPSSALTPPTGPDRPPSSPRSRGPLLAGLAVVLAIALVSGLVAALRHDSNGTDVAAPAPGTSSNPAGPSDSSAPAVVDSSEPDDIESSSDEPAVDPQVQARTELDALAAEGLQETPLDGRYAAQLASKHLDKVDRLQVAANGTHVFHATDILAEHQALVARSSDAEVVLLLSTTYGKRQLDEGQPMYVTFALSSGFDSASSVHAWCARTFSELSGEQLENACTPRRIKSPNG